MMAGTVLVGAWPAEYLFVGTDQIPNRRSETPLIRTRGCVAMAESPLPGGGRTEVSRDGDIVYRGTGPWAPAVHALLRHLESVGFEGAPRVVGSGFDEKGREVLGYIDGDVVHPRPWGASAFAELGQLLRRLHEATSTFTLPDDAVWRRWHARGSMTGDWVIGHCDPGPWNIVAREGRPIAFVDWEVAGPVDRLTELAQACWLNAQLHDDDVARRQGLASVDERAEHVRLLLDGYGLAADRRSGFVDRMIEFAIRDAAAEAVEAGVTPATVESSAMWGIAWRARSAAWMLNNRGVLQAALAS